MQQDFAYAARSLRRTPVVATTIVLTLALGLGLNTAMFSLLDVLYLRPPAGVDSPADVYRVWQQIQFSSGIQYWPGYDYPSYRAVDEALGGDASTALYTFPAKASLGKGEPVASAQVSYATASFFSLLGARAARGRTFAPDEDRMGAPTRVAVVSSAFWQRALHGDPAVLGRSVTVGKLPYTIIGVMQQDFTGVEIDAVDVWLPLAAYAGHGIENWWEGRNVNGFQILVRPSASIGAAQLNARITTALHRPELLRSPADSLMVVKLGSIIRARGPGEADQEFAIASRLGGVAVLVLLIAIANVVNLLLARAVRRRREIAVRLALGISRTRLLRLLVSESVLLAAIAAGAALLAAYWGGGLLRGLLLPDVHWAATPLHWRVLVFSTAIALVAGLLAGLVPAIQSTAPDLTEALKTGAAEGGVHRSRLRNALIVVQAALSMVLLVGAGLFVQSLSNVRGLDIGFDADRLLFASVGFADADSARDARLGNELGNLAERLRSAPGVEQVALAGLRPMYGFSFTTFYPEADTIANKPPFASFSAVSPEYFDAIGIRVLRGSGFPMDVPATQTVVINEAFADALWPHGDAIGRCMRFDKPDAPCYTITGIVETARRSSVIEDPQPQYYLPLPFDGWEAGSIIVRSDPGSKPLVISEIRETLRRAFPTGTPTITQMTEALEPQYRPWKLGATLFTLFGLLALVVAAVGIYSTISYGVSQRVHEMGVRLALGARASDVIRHIVGGGVRTVVIGVIVGIALSLAAGRLVAALLYGIAPSDPKVLVAVSAVLIVVAVAAALVPAWRAARVDPVSALRAE